MAMMRKNPLPKGRYWTDVFKEKIPQFEEWLKRNKDTVTVEKRESFGDVFGFAAYRVWYLFSVTAEPGPIYMQRVFGFPTLADQAIKGPEDTVQRPPPQTPSELMKDTFGGVDFGDVKTWGTIAVIAWLILK